MNKKTYKLKHMAEAFLAGAMLFSGISLAAASPEGTLDAIKHTTSKISYYVNGKDHSTPAGQFMNQGTAAPDSIVQNGTTYVPVRIGFRSGWTAGVLGAGVPDDLFGAACGQAVQCGGRVGWFRYPGAGQ
ncbi:superoxide dismutase copper/zinc binding protein [Paenibacillus vortex V453]|uniref:Superoxide dismutase copper/zinc binding protein n=1 Tax=Paenibacillus vortex V453 TaxID=715225 RepID=A0A2R9SZF9_9BACL|nr:hypothetical protein [Paenibacillus vortex]EFU42696.1 superoxide dismutase copper/zinc binding protein [Paenibacillus vortex V453]